MGRKLRDNAMTLKLGPTPPAAIALVLKELESRLSAREFIPALQGAAKLSNGVPFYRISYAGLKRLKPIASCKAVGWCFLLAGGAEPATAVVGKERSQWHFRGMGARDFALRFISAVRKAEASYAKGPSFELRLLEAPSAHYYAVWLHAASGRSKFLTLPAPGRRRLGDAISEAQLNKQLKAASTVGLLPKSDRAGLRKAQDTPAQSR
jgi:hypothetical protein